MADQDLTLSISVNDAAVAPAAAEVKTQTQGIGAAALEASAGFTALGETALGAVERIVLGASSARNAVMEMGASFKEARDLVTEVGEAMIAAFAVEKITEFAKQMGDTAEQTQHTADTFGLTTGEVQALKAEASGLGVPFDAFTNAMQRSSRALTTAREGSKQAQEAFKVLGINIHEPITETELLQKELAGLANIQDIPTRLGIAMQVFGRNIQQIAPLIGVTREQLDGINQATTEYGIRNDEAQAAGLKLADAFNINKIAMQGLDEALTAQLAPTFTHIVEGMNAFAGAVIRAIQPGSQLRETLAGLIPVVVGVGAAIAASFAIAPLTAAITAVRAWGQAVVVQAALAAAATRAAAADAAAAAGTWVALADASEAEAVSAGVLDGVLGVLAIGFEAATAAVMEFTAALLLDPATWVLVAVGALAAGLYALATAHHAAADAATENATAHQILLQALGGTNQGLQAEHDDQVEAAKAALAHAAASLAAAQATAANTRAEIESIGANERGIVRVQELTRDLAAQSAVVQQDTNSISQLNQALAVLANWKPPKETLTNLGAPHTPKAAAAHGPKDRVAEWEQSFRDTEAASSDFFGDETAKELAYWQNIIATNHLSATELLAIKRQMFDEERTEAQQSRSEALNASAQETAAAVDSANNQLKATVDGINARIDATKAAAQRGDLSPKAELADLLALNAQELAAEEQHLDDVTNAKLQGLQRDEQIYQNDAVNLARTKAAELTLIRDYVSQWTALTAQGALKDQKTQDAAAAEFEKTWTQRISTVVNAFGSGIEGMIRGTDTFRQAMLKVWDSILNSIVSAIEKMVTKWIVGEIAKTSATQTGNAIRTTSNTSAASTSAALDFAATIKAVTNSAVKAAGAAYSAMAGIPIIGPALGAAAAGVAFVAVEAFGALASAEGGYDIPSGVNPLVQTHAEEMILPARIANPLRSMADNFQASNFNSPGASNDAGGVTHVHNWHVNALSGADFQDYLETHQDHFQRGFETIARGGKLAGLGIGR